MTLGSLDQIGGETDTVADDDKCSEDNQLVQRSCIIPFPVFSLIQCLRYKVRGQVQRMNYANIRPDRSKEF